MRLREYLSLLRWSQVHTWRQPGGHKVAWAYVNCRESYPTTRVRGVLWVLRRGWYEAGVNVRARRALR